MSVIINGTDGVTFNDASLQGAAASPFGLKNRIIKGDMVVSQRNGTSTVTPANVAATYLTDRFRIYKDSGATITSQQSTTAPTGFTNSLLFTVSTGSSPTSAQEQLLIHTIEGFNIADLGWGTANAQTITLSFRVRSSVTGTFAGALQNTDLTATYVFNYVISSANTWETKTITISGPTTGTFLTTNGAGISVIFDIGSGSNYETTANTWTTGNKYRTSGAVQLAATTGATWYVTGVQLERNTTATPFEWISYGTELALCQRYYIKLNTYGVYLCIPSTNRNDRWSVVTLPVPMRSSPTLTLTADAGVAASTVDNITITISADAGNTTTAKSWTSLISSAEF